MKYTVAFFLIICLFSCETENTHNKKHTKPQTTTTEAVDDSENKIVEKRGDVVITKIKPQSSEERKGKEYIVSFFGATVYAGATDYFFKDEKGKTIKFRQSNIEEEQTFKMPEGMLSSDDSEGPAGANPEMRGKKFKLKFDEEGKVTVVEKL